MLKGAVALALGLVISKFAFSAAFSVTKIELDDRYNMGALHLVMMGLNDETNGVWHAGDVAFTESFLDDSDARKEAQKAEIIKRLNDFGISGLLTHGKKKMLTIFNDGSFAWGCEGDFYHEIYPVRNKVAGPFLRDMFYNNGNKYKILSTVQQGVWLFVLFLCALGIFVRKNKGLVILSISLVGIILFNMIFEARARYLFVYLPVFIIFATYVLSRIVEVGIPSVKNIKGVFRQKK